MRAQLISLDDGQILDIVKDLILVGRGETCDLQLTHKSVSKLHCVLVRSEGSLLLRDLGSTNGTRVNGERIRRAFLLPNDRLHIASLRYRVHLGPGPAAPVSEHERTQNIDGDDLRRLMRGGDDADSDPELPAPDASVRQNDLPDVFEEPKPNEKKKKGR